MNIDLIIKNWAFRNFPNVGVDASVATHIKNTSSDKLLVQYINWQSRLVPARPRRVMVSSALSKSLKKAQFQNEFKKICADIEAGKDVTKYLSKGVALNKLPRPGDKRRQHLDLLLNDWGIHHLHLSDCDQADGFVSRTKELLFVVFRDNEAFLIDILDHNSWGHDAMLKTLVDDWADRDILLEVKGVIGLSGPPLSAADRLMLRKAGIGSLFEYDGRVWKPPDGVTTSGYSIKTGLLVNKIMRSLKQLSKSAEGKTGIVTTEFSKLGVEINDEDSIELYMTQGAVGLLEPKSHLALILFRTGSGGPKS